MTEKRVEHLITYFEGSLSVLDMMREKEPEKFGPNAKISSAIFSDVINVLRHVKTLGGELEKVEQNAENYESVFEEIANSLKK